MFTLDLARAHIYDLHRAAEISHHQSDASRRDGRSRLRRLVGRTRTG